jgi:hypothetical protein
LLPPDAIFYFKSHRKQQAPSGLLAGTIGGWQIFTMRDYERARARKEIIESESHDVVFAQIIRDTRQICGIRYPGNP